MIDARSIAAGTSAFAALRNDVDFLAGVRGLLMKIETDATLRGVRAVDLDSTMQSLVDGAILMFDGQATTYIPGKGCYRCLYPAPPPPGLVPSCAEAGVLGAMTGTIGSIQATEVLKLILEVGEPLVKLYFALGETALPADATAPIDSVIEALQAAPEKKALLSGFHDETGTAALNAEVARKRAIAVREALIIAGIPAQRVLLRRPAVTLGGADAAEARRVEVRVQ